MPEIHNINFDRGVLMFSAGTTQVPQCVLNAADKAAPDKDLTLVCRMGDPDLLQCVVYKKENEPGGYFALLSKKELLYAAIAETNLVFAEAFGHFGEMTANARYGVDVFENLEEPDD